ncbi:MAG: dTMP kinase [Promicromonosporaceae bacterium]|nr:dTMP kinase [Promicromonosporaceae bacterium]
MCGDGYFISFEGGDGSGKTTQAELFAAWLRATLSEREVLLTREPGGTALGQRLRQEVLHGEDVDPRTEALLYATDRAHHVASVVRPALARGAIVISDRYLDSSVAYQAGGRVLPAAEVEALSRWATGGLLPATTILLDVDPETAASRLTRGLDRLESAGAEFHARTRAAYLQRAAAEPERFVVVSAAGTVEEVHARIVAAYQEARR